MAPRLNNGHLWVAESVDTQERCLLMPPIDGETDALPSQDNHDPFSRVTEEA